MLLSASVPARGDLQRCRSVGCGGCRASIHRGQRCDSRMDAESVCMKRGDLEHDIAVLKRAMHAA
jgi:hypothetical protein